MNEALAVTQPLVHLVARNPVEMQEAQTGLADWLKAKIATVTTEMEEYQASLSEAIRNKWSGKGLRKAVNNTFWRKQFYEKTLDAVNAGFTIVPEFPIDVFAIRVNRDNPETTIQSTRYGRADIPVERSDIMATGTGKYVSPTPKVLRWSETRKEGDKEYKLNLAEPTELQAVEFPFRSARVEVMSATAKAMALRVFDEIGICPETRRNADPLIIGRIHLPGSNKSVSFLIAWHLNLNEL